MKPTPEIEEMARRIVAKLFPGVLYDGWWELSVIKEALAEAAAKAYAQGYEDGKNDERYK